VDEVTCDDFTDVLRAKYGADTEVKVLGKKAGLGALLDRLPRGFAAATAQEVDVLAHQMSLRRITV